MDFWQLFILDVIKWWIILIVFAAFIGGQLRHALSMYLGAPGPDGQQKMPSITQGFGMILSNAAPYAGRGIGKAVENWAQNWGKKKAKGGQGDG